jgi:hypothetical protein
MDEIWLSVRLLLLIVVANTSPIVAKRLLDPRWRTPLDGGLRFFDGRPLLGPSKTVRGVIAAIVVTAIAAPFLSIQAEIGALVGAAAMAGDALSSFVKRRLGVVSGGQVMGLDQIPESLLPLIAVQGLLDLSLAQIFGITLLFFALEIPLTRVSYRLGIRDREN